jgi:hypothetical protein
MRRIPAALALVLCLLGCGAVAVPTPEPTRGEQVPLLTEDGPEGTYLLRAVIDVVADPETGTPIIQAHGVPMRWRTGFTAWRLGSETEVVDPKGNRVLVTGQRYLFRPSKYDPYWLIGQVERCPPPGPFANDSRCELGIYLE